MPDPEIESLVADACSRASVDAPSVMFAPRLKVGWSDDGTLLVPDRAKKHIETHGRVPTDVARDIAHAVAVRAGSDEIEALLFAETFVRDHVLNA